MKSDIKLKMLLLIVRQEESQKLTELLALRGLKSQMAALGEGTARSENLSLLGLSSPEKALVYTLGEAQKVHEVLAEVSKTMQFDKPGGGVGLILPLTGICGKEAFDMILEQEVKHGH